MTDTLLEIYEGRQLDPEQHGKLGAHVGGGNPLVPLLRDYVVQKTAQAVPATCNRDDASLDYGMLANDSLGDCVPAEVYHSIMHAHAGVGKPVPNPDQLTPLVVDTYSAVGGYVSGDESTDNGTDPVAMYAYWRKHGVPWLDPTGKTVLHKIVGSVQILPHDGVNLKRGIYEFDGAGLSLAMPIAWQTANIWDAGGDAQRDPKWQPGGWGGHQVLGVSFDGAHIAVITWGGVKLMTWTGWGTYGQLAQVGVTKDELSAGGVSETGLALGQLESDFKVL